MPTHRINGEDLGPAPAGAPDLHEPAPSSMPCCFIDTGPVFTPDAQGETLDAPEPLSALVRQETSGLSADDAAARIQGLKSGMRDAEWREAWINGHHPAHRDAVALLDELHRIAEGGQAEGAPGREASTEAAGDALESDPAVREGLAASMLPATPSSLAGIYGGEAAREELVATADLFAQAGVNGQEAREIWAAYTSAALRPVPMTETEQREEAETTAAALRDAWGELFDAKIERAEAAAHSWGLAEVIERLGLGGNRRVIETLARVGPRDAHA